MSSDHEHRYVDSYYGWHCEGCDLFYAYGSAPWEDFDNEDGPDEDFCEHGVEHPDDFCFECGIGR